MAVAILILLFTAIRLRNLAGCHLERNIVRNGSGQRQPIRFVFERQEVKGHRMLNKPIPDLLAQALDLYLTRYRPLLVGAHDGGWLFPGRVGSGRRPRRPWPDRSPRRSASTPAWWSTSISSAISPPC